MDKIVFLCLIVFGTISCSSEVEEVLELAGENRLELQRVLQYYDSLGEPQKREAAEYLIAHMPDKYSFKGEQINRYDTLFRVYARYWPENVDDSEEAKALWDELKSSYGVVRPGELQKVYDIHEIKAGFLIRHIDLAFEAWEKSPLREHTDFEMFCRYVLPYRIGHEPLEDYRLRYLRDSALQIKEKTSPSDIIAFWEKEIHRNRNFRNSQLLWGYPLDIPISVMEQIRRGACRHMVNYQASAMRAAGLPVTVDRAIWANRSLGHSWNVLMLDSARIYPFDALSKRRLKFAYKPAKIFRQMYDTGWDAFEGVKPGEIPASFFVANEMDVTDEYVKAYDVALELKYKPLKGNKNYGIICVFDNKKWRPVYWGKIRRDKMYFEKMAADVLYLAAYYEEGGVIPATDPFILREDGKVEFCTTNKKRLDTMLLERKYPLLDRVKGFAGGMINSRLEGANRADFSDTVCLLTIRSASYIVTDSIVLNAGKYRFIRLHSALDRHADYAEVEFYGKKALGAKEEHLTGKIIGAPALDISPRDPYTKAMDGRLETWFSKRKGVDGWVGLDLGEGKMITRIRFCPRSDTNFVIPGDEYELFWWEEGEWRSMGRKVATDYFIEYHQVPAGALYLLSNHSRGKEERVFTWEDGKQVWW